MGFSYNFFSVEPNSREITGARHTHSLRLDLKLATGDLISGKLFYAYDHEDTFYFFEVVLVKSDQDVYICRTHRTDSRRVKRRKKILARSDFVNTSGIILRKIFNSKFRKETRTKPSCHFYSRQAA